MAWSSNDNDKDSLALPFTMTAYTLYSY